MEIFSFSRFATPLLYDSPLLYVGTGEVKHVTELGCCPERKEPGGGIDGEREITFSFSSSESEKFKVPFSLQSSNRTRIFLVEIFACCFKVYLTYSLFIQWLFCITSCSKPPKWQRAANMPPVLKKDWQGDVGITPSNYNIYSGQETFEECEYVKSGLVWQSDKTQDHFFREQEYSRTI